MQHKIYNPSTRNIHSNHSETFFVSLCGNYRHHYHNTARVFKKWPIKACCLAECPVYYHVVCYDPCKTVSMQVVIVYTIA